MNSEYNKTQSSSTDTQPLARVHGNDHFAPPPTIAFVACRDSAASVRECMIASGVLISDVVLLSAKDSIGLRSLDGIFEALPSSIRSVIFEDIEYLLPGHQLNSEGVKALLEELKRLATACPGLMNMTVKVGTWFLADRSVA